MKYSDYYFSTGVRIRAILFGVLSGAIVWFLLGWQWGVLFGAIGALLHSFILPLMLYREDLPYIRLKNTLPKPFLIDARVRFTVKDGTVGGFFVLTDHSMIFLSLERGNHRLELSRKDVRSVIGNEDFTISIFLNDTQFIRVMSTATEEMLDILRQNGWSVSG